MKIKILGLLTLLICFTPIANAGKMMFGMDDTLHKIQDLGSEQNGEKLVLGYRTSIRFFILGVYLRDQGYVVYTPGTDKYMPLNGEAVSNLQKSGLLPNPLPPYKIDTFSYVFGYSLWLFIAGITLYGVIKKKIKTGH